MDYCLGIQGRRLNLTQGNTLFSGFVTVREVMNSCIEMRLVSVKTDDSIPVSMFYLMEHTGVCDRRPNPESNAADYLL